MERGDTLEFSDRLVEIRRRLHDAVLRVCPASLSGHADDITQEALVRVSAMLEREGDTDRSLPSSYIRRTAYNATIDAIRRHRLRASREQPMESNDAVDPRLPNHGQPHQSLVGRELGAGIEVCLGEMVRPRRVAVILHLQGHTVAEIGRILDWPVTRANNLVYRGLHNLRRCLTFKGLAP